MSDVVVKFPQPPITVLFNRVDDEEPGKLSVYNAEYKSLVVNPKDSSQSLLMVFCPPVSQKEFGIPLPFPIRPAQHFLLETIDPPGFCIDLRGNSYSNALQEFNEKSGRFSNYTAPDNKVYRAPANNGYIEPTFAQAHYLI